MGSIHWFVLLALVEIFFITNLANVQGQQGILFLHGYPIIFCAFSLNVTKVNLYCKLCVHGYIIFWPEDLVTLLLFSNG